MTPVTILTSNRTRDLHDAVSAAARTTGWTTRARARTGHRPRPVPGASEALAAAGGAFGVAPAQQSAVCRRLPARPGIAEVEWAKALVALDTLVVTPRW